MEVLNLDEIKNDDKIIKLDGKDYKVPGDLPVQVMFELLENSEKLQKEPSNPELNKQTFELLAKVFKVNSPDVTGEWLSERISQNQYSKLMGFIFGTIEEEQKKTLQEEEEVKE